MIDLTDAAVRVARPMVLELSRHDRTPEKFREIAEEVAQLLGGPARVPVEAVFKRLEADFDVWVPTPVIVRSSEDHEEWFDRRRGDIAFAYWQRYAQWLEDKEWKSATVDALDESTDQVVGLLEDPARPGPWKTYGMVYGQVQSGKTASYTGVICKAVDAGYQVVVVLTSQLESLRHQTQARLDLEFLGLNSKFAKTAENSESSVVIGVGTLGMKRPRMCMPVTTRVSDFTKAQFEGSPVNIREVCVLVVAKKNARILENLRDWLGNFTEPGEDGVARVRDTPLLLVDDEADYASVDTKRVRRGRTLSDPDHDPTKINQAVRGILELFEQRAYLAYTATPFANIFINDETDHPEYGLDLFPRNFLVALEPPSDYCGPEVVFGLEDPSAAEIRDPLPVIRPVNDYEHWLPDGHRNGDQPQGALPVSLVQALDAFVLSTAVRRVRSRDHSTAGGHNTMLVHVTRYTSVQGEVARQIEEHLRRMRGSWGDYGTAGTLLRERLRRVWDKDFEPTHAEMADRSDVGAFVGPRVSWESVEEFVAEILDEVSGNVRRVNGQATDVLDYQSSTPVTVVAVGGDKLSRGLTLEGLTVSYYLRASRMYDTLLQMGRWFGYRSGYLDATRLYTTPELISYYVHITRANRELMDLVTALSLDPSKTPKDVGLRVLDDGQGNLQVTAAAKMRSSRALSISLAGTRAETLVMRTDEKAQHANYVKLERLVERVLPCPEVGSSRLNRAGKGLFRTDVPAEVVKEFLTDFRVSPRVLSANPENLLRYIESQLAHQELTSWTVAVTGGSSKNPLSCEKSVPLVKRKAIKHEGECEVGVLVSPAHEALDLPGDVVLQAEQMTREAFEQSGRAKKPARASGDSLRRLRDPRNGLLLVYPIDPEASRIDAADLSKPIVGFAVVFPSSERAKPIQYRVNEVFLRNLRKVVAEEEEPGE